MPTTGPPAPSGRRARKMLGKKKKVRAQVAAAEPAPAAPLPATAEVPGVSGRGRGVAAAPRKWTAEQRAEKRAKREAEALPKPAEADGDGGDDGGGDGGGDVEGDGGDGGGEEGGGDAGAAPAWPQPPPRNGGSLVAPGEGRSKHAAARRARAASAAAAEAAAAAAAKQRRQRQAAASPAAPPPAPRPQRSKPSALHGSHFGHGASGVVNDEWQTTRAAWEELLPALETSLAAPGGPLRARRVWMPFWYDGECAQHLRALGFERVHHANEDFFGRVGDAAFLRTVDLVVDNPPYTSADVKSAVLASLAASRLPFCLLLPSSVVFSALLREALDCAAPGDVQLVLPRRVHVCKTGGPAVPFKQMVWLCYRMRLARDLFLVGS